MINSTLPPRPARQSAKGPAPLPLEGFGSRQWWDDQITAAEEKVKKYAPGWKKNIARLIGHPLDIMPTADTVVVPLDHANVEQKKALLYFKNPEVQLTAAPGHQAQADAVQAFGTLLNKYLGPDGVDAESTMDELLTDVLCPSGIGWIVLGLDVTEDGTKPVIVGYQETLAMGSVLGLQPVQTPIVEQAPNIIHQRYFMDRISPLYGLVPARFHGSNFDRAPWLGYLFEMDAPVAQRRFGLTDDEMQSATGDPQRLNEDEKPTQHDTDVVYGYVLSYKGSLYNPVVKHPEEIWRLILIKGVDRPLKHDRPYQQYAADGTTLIGLRGHFISAYTPRYVSDSAFVPSDVSITRQQVDELSKGRSQMVQQRDRARPMRWINLAHADPAQAAKIKNGQWQEIIFTTAHGNEVMGEEAHATYPRENFEFNRQIKSDVNEAWAFGNTQRGLAEETRRTATELSVQSHASETRMEKERLRFVKWYSRQAEKLGGLIQLFEDDRETVEILGEEDTQKLVQWDRTKLPLRFVCTAKPDTMQRQDAAGEFKRALDLYQMTANDPNVNRVELLKGLMRKANQDPTKIVVTKLPEKGPDQPKVSIAISGDDLNPSMPQFPIVQAFLAAGGVQIDPQNIALGLQLATKQEGLAAQTETGGPVPGVPSVDREHGGSAAQVEPLSKHAADDTGRLPGGGAAHAAAVN